MDMERKRKIKAPIVGIVPLTDVLSGQKIIVEAVEIAYGHTPNFHFVRSRILKVFGRDGLQKFFDSHGEEITGNGTRYEDSDNK